MLTKLDYKSIVFWEPCESPHKSDFFAAFVKVNPHIKVTCCYDSGLLDSRSAMGWDITNVDSCINYIKPDVKTIESLVTNDLESTLHVFSGLRWVQTINIALIIVKKHNASYCIWHEPRDIHGLKGKLRLIHSWLTENYHRQSALAVLAIGRNGPQWFKWAGYKAKKIIPFAYFVNPPNIVNSRTSTINDLDKIRVGYLGRFVKMKGIYDIIDASFLMQGKAVIHLAGDGFERNRMENYCVSKGVKCKFYGVLKISEIELFFSNIDVLVIASTSKDGWAVVVSESLMAGVPVISTKMVGASILLEDNLFGRIVPVHSPDGIAQAISDLSDSGAFMPNAKLNRSRKAIGILSAEAGANYFTKIISWLEGKIEKPSEFYK